jgi:hypothetical protein
MWVKTIFQRKFMERGERVVRNQFDQEYYFFLK